MEVERLKPSPLTASAAEGFGAILLATKEINEYQAMESVGIIAAVLISQPLFLFI